MTTSSINSSETHNCIPFGWNAPLQNDTKPGLISSEVVVLLDNLKCNVINPTLFIIGAPTNILSMLVFYKQGLKERINLCLFLLSVTDFCVLSFNVTYRMSQTDGKFSDSSQYGALHVFMTNENVTGLYGLIYVSAMITTVISVERCVCVMFPLRAQRCVNIKVFAFILVVGMCLSEFPFFLVTSKYRADCFYEVLTGKTSWGYTVTEFYFRNKDLVDFVNGMFYGFFLSLGCPLVVFIATVMTSIKLRHIIRWRGHASSTISSKEIGVIKMLISVSIEFLVLSTPFLFLQILPMLGNEVKVDGLYKNTFLALVNIAEVCSCTNSSINIFVYYTTGTRYRETLHKLLRSSCKREVSDKQ